MPSRSRGIVLTAVAALSVAAVALAGSCGGGGSRSGISRTAFVAQANAICAETATRLAKLPPPQVLSEIPPFIDLVVAASQDAERRIKSLGLPGDRRSTLNAMFREYDETAAAARLARAAAIRGETSATQTALLEIKQHSDAANAKARAYGLSQCAAS